VSWDRDVFVTMGTAASLSYDKMDRSGVDLRRVHDVFEDYDERYSLYKSGSELSKIASGELTLAEASEELRDTYATALEWRAMTSGEFTPHRPDGVIDLSGIVKAIAMERAGEALREMGASDWCLNVGGDVLVSGANDCAEPFSIGIVDPADRAALLATAILVGSRRACATSGSAERGDHIWTIGAHPSGFAQATVLADGIVTADVCATAIIAGGPGALDQICASFDIDAMTVDRVGAIRMTPGFALPRDGRAKQH
jgi:thiamine biosynthesis lipoprotein